MAGTATHNTATHNTAEIHAAAIHDGGQQHPLKLYFLVWGLLFVLSTMSYFVDYAGLQGLLRWSLILIFMLLKAGLIIAVFMHMATIRPAFSSMKIRISDQRSRPCRSA